MKKITLVLFVLFSVFQMQGQIASYSFSQSSGTYSPLASGTIVASYTDASTGIGRMDDVVYNLPSGTIPFMFMYDGVGFDGINISSNGFITFGTTAPGTTYTPLSATTAYAGAISAFGRDLEGGYVFTADRTSGSTDLLNASSIGPAQVGDFIDGLGIPIGTTITAIVGTTISISNAATTTGTLTPLRVGSASTNIQYSVLGTAPNRSFVIQYSNFKRYGTTLTTVQHMTLNFQFRLNESDNSINIVYGNCSPGLTTFTTVNQVGLRGATNMFATNVNNRLNTKGTNDNWLNSVQGITNTSGMLFNNVSPANVISNGLSYTWTPPVPCTGNPTAGMVAPSSLNICNGSLPGNLVATGYSTGVSGLAFQWEESLDNFATAGVNAVGGSGATTATYTPPAYSGTPIYYRLKVTCTASALFAYSTVTSVGNAANPTNQVTNATATNVFGVSATVNWTIGNGSRRVTVLSDSPTITDPTNGNAPALVANTVYSGSGQQIVYDGTAATVNVTGLSNSTTYYVKVYEYLRCGAGPYDYYYNTASGTNVISFTTVSAPLNDDCSSPIALTVGVNFASNSLATTNAAATLSAETPIPSCGNFNFATSAKDVWYSVTVPSTGNVSIETDVNGGLLDSVLQVYSGTCGALVAVNCSDDEGNGAMSLLNLTGQTPGQALLIRIHGYNGAQGSFLISAYDCPSATPAPTGSASQTFCSASNPTVASLSATGTAIQWYDAATGGNLLPSTTALVSGSVYYASQTLTCESFNRLAVTATITTNPAVPTGNASQTYCSTTNDTIANLVVSGTGIVWYDAATAGNVLPTSTLLSATTYYAASTSGSCQSTTRLAITTTENCPVAGCLNAPNGQWPPATFVPNTANCDGITVQNITTVGFAGEYSVVTVTLGQTYVFSSSITTDTVTISADGGATVAIAGIGSVTWVSTISGDIRFYTHIDACGDNTNSRTRSLICGVPSTDAPDYVNLQFPATITIPQGGSNTVYGQVYEGGLTDVAPNIVGQAPGITAWVGISPVASNTNPNTWTNWIPATWNSGNVSNNDEYQATIGATLAPGTYYYATRFRLNSGPYVYGGIDSSNNGNFWDGTTYLSGVMTVNPPPAPANDECTTAVALTPGGVFNDFVTNGTNLGATTSSQAVPTTCFGYNGGDVWYSVVVPASGSITIETGDSTTGATGLDTVISIYSGTCGALTQIDCDDDGGVGAYSFKSLTGLTAGSTLYIRVYEYGNNNTGGFGISAYDGSLGTSNFDTSKFVYYPNPVNDILNLQYSQEISKVQVINLLGQQVISKALNATQGQIDMSGLPAGTYLVKITADGVEKTIKVLKQ